ncbi:movement protein [Prunus virus T]|uniref:Movement protein n=1 Tax=Prunus virus T TaxID=1472425 RepID=A0A075DN09_9VIRU|nr:movement protein [Prunus virus T]AHM92770.1 movement protein [Prunus virus T]
MSLVDVGQFRRKVNATGSIASAVDSSAIYKLSPFHALQSDTYVRKSEFKVKMQQTGERGVACMSVPLFDDHDKQTIRESKMPYVHIAVVLIQISCLFDWAISEGMEGTFALMDTLFDNVQDNVIRACHFRFEEGRAACCFKLNFPICAEDALKGRPIVPYIKVVGANVREGLRGFSVSVGTIFSLNKTEFPSVPMKIDHDFVNIVGTEFLPKEKLSELTCEEISDSFQRLQTLPKPVTASLPRGRKEPTRIRDYSVMSSSGCLIEKDGSNKEGKVGNATGGRRSVDNKVQTSSKTGPAVLRRCSSFSQGDDLWEHSTEGSKRTNRVRRSGSVKRLVRSGVRGAPRADGPGKGISRGGEQSSSGRSLQIQGEFLQSGSESDSAA